MVKRIEELVPDIEKLFEGHTLEEAATSLFGDEFSRLLKDRLEAYNTNDKEKNGTLRLSNIGWPLRKLWYSVKGVQGESLDVSAKIKFLYGDLVETLFVHLAKAAGHDVRDIQREVSVDGVPGHIDAIVDGVLIDFKSASTFSYKKFVDGGIYDNDPFGYVAQLTAYKKALGVERAGWVVFDKTLGNFAYVELRDEDFDIHKRIEEVRSAINSDTPPERCYPDKSNDSHGNRVLDIGCSYCWAKQHCWADANDGQGLQLRLYSTGPRWFTKLVREPRLKTDYEKFPTK